MQCSTCASPLGDADLACPRCGAPVSASSDSSEGGATLVTGSASARSRAPRRGQVLGERYELLERLEHDGLCGSYRAFDQETEETVLLRVIHQNLLADDEERQTVVERLQSVVGTGGRFVPGLLDCDREGRAVYVVEPMPQGTSFREVMIARTMRSERFAPRELLPVVARLVSGLLAVPPPWRHGDVRAERIWIDPDNLAIAGAFIVAALPEGAVAAALQADATLRNAFAPEVIRGNAGDAADRWAVARVTWEALTGLAPPTPGTPVPPRPSLGKLDDLLRRHLSVDPAARPPTLHPVVDALAEMAAMPVPDLDPAPFRRARRAPSAASAGARTRVSKHPEEMSSEERAATETTSPRSEAPEPAEKTLPRASQPEVAPKAAALPPPPTSNDPDKTSRQRALSFDDLPSAPPIAGVEAAPATLVDPDPPEGAILEPSRATEEITADQMKSIIGSRTSRPPPPAEQTDETTAPPMEELSTQKVEQKQLEERSRARKAAAASAAAASPPAAPSPVRARPIPGAAPEGTQEIAIEEMEDAGPKRASDGTDAALDPRLVRAALGVALEDSAERAPKPVTPGPAPAVIGAPSPAAPGSRRKDPTPSLDPRLVRAALGVKMDDSSGDRALDAPGPPKVRTPIPPAPPAPPSASLSLGASPPARRQLPPAPVAPPRKNITEELDAGDLQMVQNEVARMDAAAAAPRISAPVVAMPAPGAAPAPIAAPSAPPLPAPAGPPKAALRQARRKRDATPPQVVEIPQDIKPIPRPRRPSIEEPLAQASLYDGDVLYDDSKVMPHPRSSIPAPHQYPTLHSGEIAIDEDGPRTGMGKWIILVALLFALAIVAGGFWYADSRRDAALRERRLQQRLLQIRAEEAHGQPPAPPPGPGTPAPIPPPP